MISKSKAISGLLLLTLSLLGIIMARPEPVLNRLTARSIQRESDSAKRIVLLNMTRTYEQSYWNPEYLKEAARASTSLERSFIAQLIHERFGTNATHELERIMVPQLPETSKSNIVLVLEKVRTIQH